MWRPILIVAVLATCFGCRSNGWSPFGGPGCRVPPPGTGTYGVPNTYYQPGLQTPTAIPATGSNTTTAPLNRWTSVPDSDNSPSTSSSKDQFASSSTSSSISSTAASTSTRLNGMRANEVRPRLEPAPFSPAEGASQLSSQSPSNDAPIGSGVKQASAIQFESSGRSAVTSANWQTRDSSSR